MPICTRCARLYGSHGANGLCNYCLSIPSPPEVPMVKDEEWNLAEAKANLRLCTVLGRIPKLAWYKSADPREYGGFYFGIDQGQHQYLLREKFWSELTAEEQTRVMTAGSLVATGMRSVWRARRDAEEKQIHPSGQSP